MLFILFNIFKGSKTLVFKPLSAMLLGVLVQFIGSFSSVDKILLGVSIDKLLINL